MLKVELSVDDATNLIKLIDVAVKAGGLDAAVVAVPLAARIRDTYAKFEAEKKDAA
jgi:hypothetical protein